MLITPGIARAAPARPKQRKRLRTNFVWNGAGNAVFAACQWGTIVCFAKLGSSTLVGQLVYSLAITTPLFVVAGLQLRSIQATDASRRYSTNQYLGLRVLTTFGALLVCSAAAYLLWGRHNVSAIAVLLWALAKAIDSASDALYGICQHAERMDYVGISLALRGMLGVGLVIVLLRHFHAGCFALAGLSIAWFAVLALFDLPIAAMLARSGGHIRSDLRGVRGLSLNLNLRALRSLSLEAAPLGFVALLFAVQIQVPRYVVEEMLRPRDLGLFSAAGYITIIGMTMVNALGAPASVRLSQYFEAGTRCRFAKLLKKLLIIAAAIGGAGVLISAGAGRQILTLLYTREYSAMAGVLTILCVASALSYIGSFLGYGMTAVREYRVQVPLFVVVLITTVVSCWLLTKQFGLMGTAAGVLVGNLAQLLLSAGVIWRFIRRKSDAVCVATVNLEATTEALP